jgi:hypothetical protein
MDERRGWHGDVERSAVSMLIRSPNWSTAQPADWGSLPPLRLLKFNHRKPEDIHSSSPWVARCCEGNASCRFSEAARKLLR